LDTWQICSTFSRIAKILSLIDDIAKNPQRIHTGLTINDLNNAFVARDLEKVKTILFKRSG
jgi:hypothetical protein